MPTSGIHDSGSQPEPGWRQSPATEEELYESTTRERGQSRKRS